MTREFISIKFIRGQLRSPLNSKGNNDMTIIIKHRINAIRDH